MTSWTEFHIGIIYFAGLLSAVITCLLIFLYLRSIKSVITKITGKFHLLWDRSFKSSLILAGLLGAMSVSFKDCKGNYDYLLASRYETAMKGFEQVSASLDYLTFILVLWLVIFVIMRVVSIRKTKYPLSDK